MNPPRGSPGLLAYRGFPKTARSYTLQTADLLSQNLSSLNCSPPPHGQPAEMTHSSVLGEAPLQRVPWRPVLAPGPLGPAPGQIPGHDSLVTIASDRSDDNHWDMLQTFTDDRSQINSTGPDLDRHNSPRLTRDHILGQGVGLPFVQGNSIPLSGPELHLSAAHSQSSHASPQQQRFEFVTGTHAHLMSPFLGRHHEDQITEAVGFTNPRQVPEMRSAQSVKYGGRGPKEWLCSRGDCDKRYRRLQELKRHMADKHAIQPKCPFCNYVWTRPEKIRSHLTDQHQHHFTEEECQEIRTLRGRKDTISFLLAKCRTTTLPRNNMFQAQSVSSLSQHFLLVDICGHQ